MSAELIIQGTPEWRQARAGIVTASRISDVMAKGKGSAESASRAGYRAQLIAERLTGEPSEDMYESEAMRRGKEQETYARAAYEEHGDLLIDQAGFVLHPSIPLAGCSPDGLVSVDGGVEIKCPNTSTHIDTMIRGEIPSKYLLQMQWCMACTGRAWWDFASFDDRLPADLGLWVKRLPRDNGAIAILESAVRLFNAEIEEMTAQLVKVRG